MASQKWEANFDWKTCGFMKQSLHNTCRQVEIDNGFEKQDLPPGLDGHMVEAFWKILPRASKIASKMAFKSQ